MLLYSFALFPPPYHFLLDLPLDFLFPQQQLSLFVDSRQLQFQLLYFSELQLFYNAPLDWFGSWR